MYVYICIYINIHIYRRDNGIYIQKSCSIWTVCPCFLCLYLFFLPLSLFFTQLIIFLLLSPSIFSSLYLSLSFSLFISFPFSLEYWYKFLRERANKAKKSACCSTINSRHLIEFISSAIFYIQQGAGNLCTQVQFYSEHIFPG